MNKKKPATNAKKTGNAKMNAKPDTTLIPDFKPRHVPIEVIQGVPADQRPTITPLELATLFVLSERGKRGISVNGETHFPCRLKSECLEIVWECAALIAQLRADLAVYDAREKEWADRNKGIKFFTDPKNYPMPHETFLRALKLPKDGLIIGGRRLKGEKLFRVFVDELADEKQKLIEKDPVNMLKYIGFQLDKALPNIERDGWGRSEAVKSAIEYKRWYSKRRDQNKKRTKNNLKKNA